MTEAAPGRGRTARIFALVGAAHTMSHIYLLALPPMYPLLKAEFDVSYAALGLLVTLLNVATGFTQVPVGFLVDRVGARKVLIAGLTTIALCIGAIGFAASYWMVLPLMVLAGVGNSVFHPADYAILSASVDKEKRGRAFSFHLLTGNLGFMTAPSLMIGLAALWGWRGALIAVAALGLMVVLAIVLFGHVLQTRPPDDAPEDAAKPPSGDIRSGVGTLISPPVVMMFLFFMLLAAASSGVQTFSVTALVDRHGVGLGAASAALTAFLAASFIGVAVGGYVADSLRRPLPLICAGLLMAAAMILLVGLVSLPVVLMVGVMAVAGFASGSIRPARDLMVSAVTPEGSTGKVFGFVSTGLNVGGAIAPVSLGLIIDMGAPLWVFYLLAGFFVLSVGAALVASRLASAQGPRAAAAE